MRHITIALLLLGASAFTSCSKADDPDPASPSNPSNPSTPAVNRKIDAGQLRNHWEVISLYSMVVVDSSGVVEDAGGLSQTYHEHNIPWNPDFESYITFNADNTFDHYNKDNTGDAPLLKNELKQHGTYAIKNNDTTLSLQFLNRNDPSSTTMGDFDVIAFTSNHFHIVNRQPYGAGKTYYFHLEFKR